MKTIKLITFKLMLLFLTTTLFVNCENDASLDMQDEALNETKQAPFSSRMVYTNEIENNSMISSRLRGLTQNRNNASFKSDNNGFTVDTSIAKYVEKVDGSGYSYTFAISRDGAVSSEVENLVLSVNTNTQELRTVMITYHYTAIQFQELLATGHVSTYSETTVTPIDGDFSDLLTESNTLPCTVHITTYHITPDTGETFEYGEGSTCQHVTDPDSGETECEVYNIMNIWCPPSTSSAGSGTTTNDPNSSTDPSNDTSNGGNSTSTTDNSSSNGDGSYNPNNEIVTSLVTKQEIQQVTQELNDLLGDNWELNNSLDSTNSISFDTVEELENFINEFENSFTIEDAEIVSNTNGTVIIKFKGKFANGLIIPVYINVHVTATLDNPNTINENEYNLEDITSYDSGLLPFTEWAQVSTVESTSGNTTTITINGYFIFGVQLKYIKGIEVTEQWTITVTFNNQTGEAIDMTATKN